MGLRTQARFVRKASCLLENPRNHFISAALTGILSRSGKPLPAACLLVVRKLIVHCRYDFDAVAFLLAFLSHSQK